jgi:hypothetical protein
VRAVLTRAWKWPGVVGRT